MKDTSLMKEKFTDILSQSLFRHYILWSIITVILYNLFDAGTTYITYNRFFYVDTDCYTRALRIIDWLNNFQWHEKIFPYTNYPDGEILHFTRINDIIWTFLSLPFMLFLPLKEAVFFGGMLFSPLFFILSLITVFWGLRPYLRRYKNIKTSFFFIYVFTFIFLNKLTNIFDFNRPDHHSLMFFILCFNISTVLRCNSRHAARCFWGAGILTGCGIWASSAVEGFILAGITLTVLCLKWLYNSLSFNLIKIYGLGLFVAVLTAWLLNPPYEGYLNLDNTRLSLLHVVLTGFMALSFIILQQLNLPTFSRKITALVTAALLSAALLTAFFGYNTVFAPVYDEKVEEYFISIVVEMQPATFYAIGAYIFIFLIFCLLFFGKKKRTPDVIIPALFALFYLPLALKLQRFTPNMIPSLVYLNAIMVVTFFSRRLKDKIILFIYIILQIYFISSFHGTPLFNKNIPPMSGTVLSSIFISPQLIYEQNVNAVGSPYHKNVAGIVDSHLMWSATDENKLKALLRKHHITCIYLVYHKKAEEDIKQKQYPETLQDRIIMNKDIYPWLENHSADKKYYFYKVNYQDF